MDDDRIEVRALFDFLTRNRAILASGVLLGLLGVGLALWAWPTQFTSRVLIAVESNILERAQNQVDDAPAPARVLSEAEILLSDPVLRGAVMALRLSLDTEAGDLAPRIATLRDASMARRRAQTYLIDLSVRADNAEAAAQRANAIADAYLREQVQTQREAQAQALSALRTSLEQTRMRATENAELETLQRRAEALSTQPLLPSSRIVARASAPLEPDRPSLRLTLGLGFLGGLAAGAGAAALRENYSGAVPSLSVAQRLFPGHALLAVPVRKGLASHEAVADSVQTDPLSPHARAIKALRDRMDTALGQEAADGACLCVTAVAPQDDNASIALALGRSYALSGRKTLLLVGEAAAPSPGAPPSRSETIEPESGLHIADLAAHDDTPALEHMHALIDRMHRERGVFARVVVRAAPMSAPQTDGIAREADAAVVVLTKGLTNAQDARAAIARLEGEQGRPLAIVLDKAGR